MESELDVMIKEIIEDRGVPRNIKSSLEESISILSKEDPQEMKIASIISILDDASADPNISFNTRTKIWRMVSVLEGMK